MTVWGGHSKVTTVDLWEQSRMRILCQGSHPKATTRQIVAPYRPNRLFKKDQMPPTAKIPAAIQQGTRIGYSTLMLSLLSVRPLSRC